ncbi:MAG: glycosyltransferase family 2 protein [Acidaminococcaceae bacterium]|nr:glycosyltransferase family 2 protein [Acidaminococcaceae bacterium]
MPLITIIIPVYNVEKYLSDCLDSVINQTYKNLEIILVDDGSTDDSGKICDDYAMIDNRIKVIHKHNEGVTLARIVAFQHSQGEFIMFIDSDDYVSDNIVDRMVFVQREYDVDIVSCQNFDDNDGVISEPGIRTELGFYDKKRLIELLQTNFLHDKRTLMAGMTGYLWTRLIKRTFVGNALNAGVDMIHSEDQVAMLQLLYDAQSMYVMKDRLYYYVSRHGQVTKKYDSRLWNNFEVYFKRIQQIDKCEYLKEQIPRRIFMMLRMLVQMELRNKTLCYSKRLNNVRVRFDELLFKEAFKFDGMELPIKARVNFYLLKYKFLNLYYALMVMYDLIKKVVR